jgi:DNA helicase HerA-like ATPase
MPDPLLIARGAVEVHLLPQMANRHGLIAGATGTGKTVTLQVLAEHFSRIGVPVFVADIKGDLGGISQPGGGNPKVDERIQTLGLTGHAFSGCPVAFWDMFGEQGHPVRTTISEMGPLLLGRLLGLNDTQAGVLTLVFRVADDQGLLLLDLRDLRAMVQHVGDNAAQYRTQYGNVSPASIGAIQRQLLHLEEIGAEHLFGEPALNLDDLIQTDGQGRGVINILSAEKLLHTPALYTTFLLWLLAELFEQLPEVGDLDRPKLVFFFDEAHLLFDDPPKALLEKIEQVTRLIRSKGVGVYYVTQNPLDIPDEILGQLGNRVQHALRAFTPRDQKAVRAAAQTFRENPPLDVEVAITQLGVGEALVSVLDEKGTPTPVERCLLLPPHSRIGPVTVDERRAILDASTVGQYYETELERDSAYELLKRRAEQSAAAEAAGAPRTAAPLPPAPKPRVRTSTAKTRTRARRGDNLAEAAAKSAARAAGSSIGRSITRGILGSLFGRR